MASGNTSLGIISGSLVFCVSICSLLGLLRNSYSRSSHFLEWNSNEKGVNFDYVYSVGIVSVAYMLSSIRETLAPSAAASKCSEPLLSL